MKYINVSVTLHVYARKYFKVFSNKDSKQENMFLIKPELSTVRMIHFTISTGLIVNIT